MAPRKQNLSLLIVDDDERFGRNFQRWLEGQGYNVDLATTPHDAKERIHQAEYDGVVVDYYLQFQNGLEFLQDLRKEKPTLPVILMTGVDRTIGRRALQEGAFWYLEKPIDFTEARVIFQYLVERKRLMSALARRKRGKDKGQKEEMEAALALAALAALTHGLLSAENEDELLRSVRQKALPFLGAQSAWVVPLDPATGKAEVISGGEGSDDVDASSASERSFSHTIRLEEITEELWRDLEQKVLALESPKSLSSADDGLPILASIPVPEWHASNKEDGFLEARFCLAPQPFEHLQDEAILTQTEKNEDGTVPLGLCPLAVLVARYEAAPPPDMVSRLEVLARLVGAAFAHYRQRSLFQGLGEAAKDILASSSHESLYKAVDKALRDVFEASTYYLAVRKEQIVDFPVAVENGKTLDPKRDFPEGFDPWKSLTGYILDKKQEVDCMEDGGRSCNLPEGYQAWRVGEETRVIFGLPLVVDERSIGVLSIQRHALVPFLDATRQALRTLGALVALALDRLEREKGHFEFLQKVFRRPLQDALEELAERTQKALGADIVVLYVYDAQYETFRSERVRLGLPGQDARKEHECEAEDKEFFQALLKAKTGERFVRNAADDEIFSGKFIETYGVYSSGSVVLRSPLETRDGEGSDVPVGILVVNYKKAHDFTDEEKVRLRQLGQDAALAIGAALLVERERMASQRLHLLKEAKRKIWEVSKHIKNQKNQDKREEVLAEEVVSVLQKVWPKRGCIEVIPSILYADYGARELKIPAHYPIDVQTEKERKHIAFGEGICGWVAAHRQTYYAPDVEQDTQYLKLIQGTRSEIAVPILLGDRLLGVLNVEANVPNFFTVEDRRSLEELAKELGTALGALGEQDSAQQILQIAQEAANNPARALERLVEGAFKLVDIPQGSVTAVSLFLRNDDVLKLGAIHPLRQEPTGSQTCCSQQFDLASTGPGSSVMVRAVREKQTQVVPKVEEGDGYYPCHPETRAEMAVPFFDAQGEVVGVLNVEYKNAEAIDYQDRQLLESLAAQTPIILALQEESRALRRESKQRRLSAALAALGIAAADYGHQWKNELAAFRGTVGLIEDELQRFCQRKLGWKGKLMHRLGWMPDFREICRWLQRVRTVLEQPFSTNFPPPDEEVETIEIAAWLEDVREQWNRRMQHNKVRVEIQSLPNATTHVRANRRWLTRALDNLVNNAVQASLEAARREEGRQAYVRLSASREGERVWIRVEDNGLGIPADVRPYLFQSRVPKDKAQGHGTGGLITAFVAQFYGGTVRIERTGEQGTVVVLEIPQESVEKNLQGG